MKNRVLALSLLVALLFSAGCAAGMFPMLGKLDVDVRPERISGFAKFPPRLSSDEMLYLNASNTPNILNKMYASIEKGESTLLNRYFVTQRTTAIASGYDADQYAYAAAAYAHELGADMIVVIKSEMTTLSTGKRVMQVEVVALRLDDNDFNRTMAKMGITPRSN